MPRSDVDRFIAAAPLHRRPIARATRSFADSLPPGAEVLDAGAGQAPYAVWFAHCRYRTQDWPSSVHTDGARPPDVVGDLHDLPLVDADLDAVVCTEVLEHVERPDQVLAELGRVLRPGGRLLLTVPFVVELHEEPFDHARYTSHGLRALLERAGFAVESLEPTTGWFSTLSHVLRNAGLSTTPVGQRPRGPGRLAGAIALALSEVLRPLAPWLDRSLDRRRALPLGWIAVARNGSSAQP